jgi:hypothetical protein
MAEGLTSSTPAPGPPGPPELPPAGEPTAAVKEEPKELVMRPRRFRRRRRGRGARRGGKLYRFRFFIAYGILGLVLGSAAAGFGLLMLSGAGAGDGDEEAWSEWRPTATGEAGVDQIANFVAKQYKLPSGRQLVAVVADEPLVQNEVPVSNVAIDNGVQDADGNRYTIHATDGDFMYVLCGLGQNCAIPEGQASVDRHRLLRREALELALYTFRYVPGVDAIIAFLPPRRGQQPQDLLYFRKNEFEELLDRPLRATLPSETPPPPNEMSENERKIIDQLTTRHLFKYEFTQAQDASAILVLTPRFPSS